MACPGTQAQSYGDPTPHIRKSKGILAALTSSQSQASDSVEDHEKRSNGQDMGGGTEWTEESGEITISESSDGNGGISMGNKDEGGNEDTGHEDKIRVYELELESWTKVKKRTHMKLVTTFLSVIIQSTAAVIGLHFVEQSSRASNLFTCVLITNLIGFVFLMALMWPNRHTNSPAAANALGRLGSSAAVLGFLFMMAINLPMWLILLACVALLAIMLLSSLAGTEPELKDRGGGFTVSCV